MLGSAISNDGGWNKNGVIDDELPVRDWCVTQHCTGGIAVIGIDMPCICGAIIWTIPCMEWG